MVPSIQTDIFSFSELSAALHSHLESVQSGLKFMSLCVKQHFSPGMEKFLKFWAEYPFVNQQGRSLTVTNAEVLLPFS